MVNHIRINGEALIASTGEGIQKDDRQGAFARPTFCGIKRNNFHKATPLLSCDMAILYYHKTIINCYEAIIQGERIKIIWETRYSWHGFLGWNYGNI
jgi:hypothetical protein